MKTAESLEDSLGNLVAIRTEGKYPPLFLILTCYGDADYGKKLAEGLNEEIPVYGLVASGFLEGEILLSTIEDITARSIQAIRKVQPNGPYRLAGWLSGGMIAYEMANQLIGADETVEMVGLIDTSFDYGVDKPSGAGELLQFLIMQEAPIENHDTLIQLTKDGNLENILSYCQSNGIFPQKIDNTLGIRGANVYRTIEQALLEYCLYPISAPLILYARKNNPACDLLKTQWQAFAKNNLKVVDIHGGSESILKPPHIVDLANAITADLLNCESKIISCPEQCYSPLMLIQTGKPDSSPLFCVPGAGASVTTFFSLSQALDPNLTIYGLQPRGLGSDLVPHVGVVSAASFYLKAIGEIQAHGPYRLLGHSFGGWIVFEMALQLIRLGEPIEALVLLDTDPPILELAPKKRQSRIETLMDLVELYELGANTTLGLTSRNFVGLTLNDQLNLLLSRLIQNKIMPPRTNLKALQGIFRVFETNVNSYYTPANPYPLPVHLVEVLDTDAVQHCASDSESSDNAWQLFAPNSTTWLAPGNHITMLSNPNAIELAKMIQSLF